MMKSSLLMIPAMLLFVAGTSFNTEDKVSITQDIPNSANPGAEFIVSFKVQKASISGVARLQQDLPDGFTAEENNSSGADFLFEDNSVKFIWTSLPKENDFIVSYKIKVDKNIIGSQTLNGVFVYLNEGKTIRYPLLPVMINILKENPVSMTTPSVTRKLLSIAPEKGEYRMELNIVTNNLLDQASFTDEIPSGYIAEAIDAHNATFTSENNNIKFSWSQMPAEKEFTISYLVKSGSPGPSPVINGYFSYGDLSSTQQETKQIKINEVSPTENASAENASAENNGEKVSQIITGPPIPYANLNADHNGMMSAEKGILFKVQIAATQKSSVKNSEWFHSFYNIDSNVEMTYYEGWKKYMTGSFKSYMDASAYRKKTQERIPDAFVVAYENGMRISLQEAIKNKSYNQ
jgi:hypothetical protein